MPPPEVNYQQPDKGNAILEAPVSQSQRDAYLGEILYHFIGTGSDDDLMDIFDLIVRRGLLMTVGDKNGTLDRLSFDAADNTVVTYEIMQKARVCFTDIPRDKLYDHSGEYGKFGIGFSRKTIICWGGNPVFYVPNHIDSPVTSVMAGVIPLYLNYNRRGK
jgi:Putative abortive phage resistance protein AbiGi, antitoxin